MNKYDYIFISIILVISIILFILLNNNSSNYAYVYYDNNLVNTIPLNINKEYEVDGYNGKVILEVSNNKLRVKEEISPLHICSKQGWMNRGTIVCLPNKIVINFENDYLDVRTG